MAILRFEKYHGLGNDFIVLDQPKIKVTATLARRLCDRRFGIGADQIMILLPKKKSVIPVQIWNSDGSQSEMCGNGLRALAKYLFLKSKKKKFVFQPQIRREPKSYFAEVQGPKAISIAMGYPYKEGSFEQGEMISVNSRDFIFHALSFGNPHAVIFTEENPLELAQAHGPAIENHSRFPERTNVEFVRVLTNRKIEVAVWERGAGLTLACGSGASAAAYAAMQLKGVKVPLEVRLPGGDLQFEWDKEEGLIKSGPAEFVYRGEFKI